LHLQRRGARSCAEAPGDRPHRTRSGSRADGVSPHPAQAPALSAGVDKIALVRQIIAQLDAELEGYARSARTAHAEATHEQSKAENKYDTRGLEASYLAHGQSRLAAATQQARR